MWQSSLTGPEILRVIECIQYKDWQVNLEEIGDHFGIRVVFMAPCAVTTKPMLQTERLWILEDPITQDSLIKTIFAAVKACEEHELMENFKYRGIPPFNPPITILDHMEAFVNTMYPGN